MITKNFFINFLGGFVVVVLAVICSFNIYQLFLLLNS